MASFDVDWATWMANRALVRVESRRIVSVVAEEQSIRWQRKMVASGVTPAVNLSDVGTIVAARVTDLVPLVCRELLSELDYEDGPSLVDVGLPVEGARYTDASRLLCLNWVSWLAWCRDGRVLWMDSRWYFLEP